MACPATLRIRAVEPKNLPEAVSETVKRLFQPAKGLYCLTGMLPSVNYPVRPGTGLDTGPGGHDRLVDHQIATRIAFWTATADGPSAVGGVQPG